MANLALYVDLRAGDPTPGTRYALAEARKIADTLGATICAVVAGSGLTVPDLERLASTLGQAGADRVFVASDPALAGPPLWSTHGPALESIARKLQPRLFVFPAGTTAAQLAAPLAAKEAAVFFPDASVSLVAEAPGVRTFKLLRRRADWSGVRTLDVLNTRHTVVAVLVAGEAPRTGLSGCGNAELEIVHLAMRPPPALTVLSVREDPSDRATQATTVIWLAGDKFPSADEVLDRTPAGTAVLVVRSDAQPLANLDVLCPTNLILASQKSLPMPPPIRLSAHGKVVLSGPRKPPLGRFRAVFWRAQDGDLAWLEAALGALERGASGEAGPAEKPDLS